MSAEPQRNPHRWRHIIVVVLGLAVLYAGYRYTLHRMVEAKLNAIREQGYPVTWEELDRWYARPATNDLTALYTNALGQLVISIGNSKWVSAFDSLLVTSAFEP